MSYYWQSHQRHFANGRLAWYAEPADADFWHRHWQAKLQQGYLHEAARCDLSRDEMGRVLLRELPRQARRPETRRSIVPTRCLFGTDDPAIHISMASPETVQADAYELEPVPGCGHFIADERPDLVRLALVDMAERHATPSAAPDLTPDRG